MEQKKRENYIEKERQEKLIILQVPIDTHKREIQQHERGVDFDIAVEFQRVGFVNIKANIFAGRGIKGGVKDIEGMRIILKEYDKVIREDIVRKGYIEFSDIPTGHYVLECVLKEIAGDEHLDTFVV